VDVDVADETHQRGLQQPVAGGSIEVVKLLVALALISTDDDTIWRHPRLRQPLRRREIAAFLAPRSRDVLNTHLPWDEGAAARICLRQIGPRQCNGIRKFGFTPLFALPDDEDEAGDMTAFPTHTRRRSKYQEQGRVHA